MSYIPTMAYQLRQQKKIHPVVDAEAPPPPSARLVDSHTAAPRETSGGCFCRTLLILILVATTIGIMYLVFDPKLPKYSVDKLRIVDFTVDTGFNARASFNVTVTANNPNKRTGIHYEGGSELSVWYSDTSLCSGSFPAFYQEHENVTVTTVSLSGHTHLGSGLITALQRQQQTGMVPLEFRGDVPVRAKLGELMTWKVTSKLTCDLVVDSLNDKSQNSIKTSSCKFSLKL